MALEDIFETVERVGDRDGQRRRAFREELDAGADRFPRTREALAAERGSLDRLADLLADEADNIEELADYSEFLTADQAVRHRSDTVSKLERHNDHLRTFLRELETALDVVESNLNVLETDGPEAVEASPEAHFEAAREAIEEHNAAVEGLGTNMTILNAYLV